jgi:hypothetical protein
MKAVRVLLALLAGVAVVLGFAPVTVAQAAEPQAFVSITLTSMTPALPARDGTVEVTGKVTNVSDSPVSNLQAILWRSSEALQSAESVTRALGSAADDPIGRRLFDQDYQNIPSEADRTLAPGKSTTFALTTEVANLDLPRADGIYLFGVQVRGRTVDDPARDQTLGRARTFLPLVETPPGSRLRMTSLVVLSSRPSQLRRGVLADDHLADEVRPGGRLARLLEAADGADVSFAVDPELVEELTTMRAGYTVQGGDGDTTAGSGQSDATAWLQRFETLARDRDGFQLLYGSPDIAALVHDRQTSVLSAAAAAGRRVSATAQLPLLVLPGGGFADAATLAAAGQLNPRAVVLSDASAIGDGPLLTAPGAAPVIRYSNDALGGGPGPDPRNTQVQLRQRVLTDTWVEASAAAGGPTRGQVRLVTATSQVQDDDAGVEAPWMSRTTLSELLAGTGAPWDGKLAYPEEAVRAELTSSQLSTLRGFARSSTAYRELLVHPDQSVLGGDAAVVRAASVAWRGQELPRSTFLQPQQKALGVVLNDQLRISTNPKVSTVAREGVEFPITIQNLLPADETDRDANAVKLRLVFVSANRQRLTIEPIEAPLIRAGENLTRNARVTAKANGTVRVRAQLQTASGTPVGRPRTIDVRVTQNGTTGWAIAALALVLFGGGTALRIRQVARTPAATGVAAGPAAGALTSAPPSDAPDTSRPTPPPGTRDA